MLHPMTLILALTLSAIFHLPATASHHLDTNDSPLLMDHATPKEYYVDGKSDGMITALSQ